MINTIKKNKKLFAGILLTAILIIVARALRLMINDMESLILPTLLIYLRGVIHLSLALVWTVSVYQRITNKQARAFVLSVGVLMLVWIVTKTAKYEFFPNNTETLARYLWYCYYVPMLLIPLNGIFVAQYIRKPDDYRLPKWVYLFYIPVFLLLVGVLTNDLHTLMFAFPNGIENFNSGYTYGILYWISMAWYISLTLAFVIILIYKSRLPGAKSVQKIPLVVAIVAVAFWILYTAGLIDGDLTVIDYIIIGTLLETAIQTGLIPTNTGHEELFKSTTVVEGKDFHFVVSVTGNYREGANFKVKANGVELTKTSGYYVITNVTANQVITVEGVEELPKYTVTLPTGTGFTFAPAAGNSSPVYEGGSFSFVVSIADGYRANANFKVKANGVELTKDGTGYTITNITANVTVTVEGVEKIPTGGGSVTPPVHTHNYGTTWKTDGTNHWHECSCGDKKDSAAHTGGTATCTAKAKCSVCNVEKGDLAPHSYVEGKCSCGATDPNYVAPHEHTFVEGKCECGETDPNYTPETNDPGTDVPGTDVPCNDDPQTPDDNDGLGTGAIVAIVVGSVLVVGVGGFALVWFVIKKKTWAEFLAIFKKG